MQDILAQLEVSDPIPSNEFQGLATFQNVSYKGKRVAKITCVPAFSVQENAEFQVELYAQDGTVQDEVWCFQVHEWENLMQFICGFVFEFFI